MVINWYGEACFKIQSGEFVLLTDPFLSEEGLTPPRFKASLTLLTKILRPIPYEKSENPIVAGAGEYELAENQIFSDYEKELFSHVVELAEREGKPVELLVVPAVNPFDAMAHAANALRASRLVTGVSARMESDELARLIGLAWERLPEPRHAFSVEIISPDRESIFRNLGPHPPRLWPEDIDLLHDIWLDLSAGENIGSKLHHRDVVGLALRRLKDDLKDNQRAQAIQSLRSELRKG